MYLTYADYQNMGGTLDETTFNNYEYEAETIVNWYTFNRLKDDAPEDYPDELAKCMYALIELVKVQHDALTLGKTYDAEYGDNSDTSSASVKSMSNDGVSISFNTVDASDIYGKLTSLGNANPYAQLVFRYLQGVRNSLGKRLTYRGLYPDE